MALPEKVEFIGNYKGWKCYKGFESLDGKEKLDIARLLLSIRESFNEKIYQYLGQALDLEFIQGIVDSIVKDEKTISGALYKAKSPTTTKKLSEIVEIKEAKDIAKGILTEMILEKLGIERLTPEVLDKYLGQEPIEDKGSVTNINKEMVHFLGNYSGWKCVKRMEVEDLTEDLDIAMLLLSIRESFNNKIYDYMSDKFDMESLDELIEDIIPKKGRFKEEDIASTLSKLNSPNFISSLERVSKDPKATEILKRIAAEKTLAGLKLSLLNAKMVEKYIEKKALIV
ncbi:MAG: hypothetical protein APG12_00727 [Candidatus Methanofastidiosum methylothiophilum]|uniref:DUF2666 domain-containing protein n=1 Tax=Candidatus Methanofastidiosum methylothiophilum TaxID=1705564 RepID=A0A150J018_9EURY|nr:MAG: hypothetical protein APG10_00675 [Candidatus Methanofastidiosum methylthiophilus]KYC47975.1 MAG: hypothetical protein APG11_00750 [Candidatus Methanofastidiosum methylthiophilus]KYC50593.1 MAG: hypothetical protein APG12_00727 [Candidatus Methanofastidiosum methylthiophilus]